MIRTTVILLLLVLQTATLLAEEHCRRVQLNGTVQFVPAPGPGFRGTVNAPEGEFKIELLFRENGGEPISQKNFIELTDIKSHSFGGAKECTVSLPEAARKPRSFTVSAELMPYNVVSKYGSDPKEHVSDQLDFSVKPLPPMSPISYSSQCEGGKAAQLSDFGASYNQLLLPLATRRYVLSIELNKAGKNAGPDQLDVLNGRAKFTWEDLQTMVPCSSFE